MRYRLSPDDLTLARTIAAGRNNVKVRAGIRSNKIAGVSDYDIHYSGVMGELAVARWAGVDIDRTIHLDGDKGYDLVTAKGTVDIKTRRRQYCDLIIMPGMVDFTADYCVLCWIAGERDVEIVGSVSQQRFRQQAESVTLAGRPRLLMAWRYLDRL